MSIDKIKLIAFDIDGTLAETDDYYVEKGVVLMRKLMPYVKPESMEKVVRPPVMIGETVLHGIYRLLDFIGLDTLISKAHSKFSVNNEYKYREIAGMRETLELLSRHFIIGIITSGGQHSTEAFLNKFRLKGFVSIVIAAEDCKYIKPHPMPLIKMAEKANVTPENCLMVGDTIFDILCAKRAGAMSAAVKSGFDTEWLLKKHRADIMLDSVKDLPKELGVN